MVDADFDADTLPLLIADAAGVRPRDHVETEQNHPFGL
jgi:hypothetical protein